MTILKPLYVALIREALAYQPCLTLSQAEGAGHDSLELQADGTVVIDGVPAYGLGFDTFLTMHELAAFAVKAEAVLPDKHRVALSAPDWQLAGERSTDLADQCNQLAAQALIEPAIRYLVTADSMLVCADKALLESKFILSQMDAVLMHGRSRDVLDTLFDARLGFSTRPT